MLIINLFGSFDVRGHTDRPIELRSKKAQALLAYLSVHPGQPHARDKLSALLWPDVDDTQARQSLRQALLSLRRAIDPVERKALRLEGDTVTLEPKVVRVDVATFANLVARGTTDALEEAAGLYRGDLLEHLVVAAEPFEEWLVAERERLRELAQEALAKLLAKQATAASAEPAIRTALRLLKIDPLQEAVHRALMRLYVRQGRRPAALKQYQACVAVLAKELGVAPEPETRDLYQEVLQQAPATAGAEPATVVPALFAPLAEATRDMPTQSLVGRDAELARLTKVLGEAWSGGPHLVLLEGEAGIGKSRLMEALAAFAAARGGRVLVGRAHESEQVLPFQPWIDALGAGHGLADEEMLSRFSPGLRAELSRLVPGIGATAARGAVGADNPLWLFEGMLELLGLLAGSQPLVVILEDLHWADEMTLRLLAFLARRLASRCVLLAATARQEELTSAFLGRLLEELARERYLVRVELAPLSRDATVALVRGLARVGSDEHRLTRTTGEVWALSEGNPFVIVECMRSLLDSKVESDVAALPRRVREVITARLERLGEHARCLLNVSAVVGREFSFALAQRAAGLGVGEAAAGVEELVRFRVLDASGEHFEFAHDRIRHVVYESLLTPTRQALHHAVGGALESLHGDAPDTVLDQLAHHYTHAGDADKAIVYLARLAEATRRRHALTDAARLLDRALAFVDRLPVSERDLWRVRLLLAKAFVFGSLGRYPEILPMLLPERERVQGLGDPRLAIEYFFRLALTSAHLGRYEDAEEFAGRARQRADEIGDPSLAGLASYALSIKSYWAGEPRRGMEHARESIRLLGRASAGHWLGMAHMSLGLNSHLAGELNAALGAFGAATDVGRAINGSQLQSHSGCCTALVYADQADWDTALATCDAALGIARSPVTQATGTAAMGCLKLAIGEPDRAASLLGEAIESLERFGFRSLASRFMSSLAEANLASGDLANARKWADRALSVASDDGSRWPIGLARRAQARIAAVAGDVAEAELRLNEALALFAELPAPLECAHTHVLAAELAGRRADRDAAARHLREALRLYRELGAPRRQASVEELACQLAPDARGSDCPVPDIVVLIINLFGGFEVRNHADRPIALHSKKAQALLAYLSAHPGQPQARDKLSALLWPDVDDTQARQSSRQTLLSLRRALDPVEGKALRIEGDAVTLDARAVRVDVATFASLVARKTSEALEDAARLYRGDLLEGLAVAAEPFEEWLVAERERLRELAQKALAQLLAKQAAAASPDAAIRTALRLLRVDPLQEAAHRTLMRLYGRQGRRAAALKQYQSCVAVLAKELGVAPEPETRDLYREILRQPPTPASPLPVRTSIPSQPAGAASRDASKQARAGERAAPREPRAALSSAAPGLPVDETPLVGRETELRQLRALLAAAAGARGHIATLTGEAGIGKTRLVGTLVGDALAAGFRVLLGRCHDSDSILPFGPWVEACRSGRATADEEILGALHPQWRAELTRLFPEARAAGLPRPNDGALSLFESVARLLEQLAARQPLILVLEDLHWADEMSLRLLAFVSRRIPQLPGVVVATARQEQLAEASMARRTLEDLSRLPQSISLVLSPLSRADTGRLVQALIRAGSEGSVIARAEEQIWALSEGNPFVAVEAIHSLGQDRSLDGAGALALPASVRELVARHLDRLGARSHQVAAAAAVIGRHFDFALLSSASELAERDVAEAVEEMVRHRILTAVGNELDFVHDRFRDVAYGRLLAPRRRLIHRAVAEALEARLVAMRETFPAEGVAQHVERLAYHALNGEQWAMALRYCEQAAASAQARSAYAEAAHALEQALLALAQLPNSHAMRTQALDVRSAMRPPLMALAQYQTPLARLREAESAAEILGDRGRQGRVRAEFALVYRNTGDYAAAIDAGHRALSVARELGDERLEAEAMFRLGQTHRVQGDLDHALARLDRSLELIAGQPGRGAAEAERRSWLAFTQSRLGRFGDARVHAEQAVSLAEAHSGIWGRIQASAILGEVYVLQGHIPSAIACLEPTVTQARTWTSPDWGVNALRSLATAYMLAERSAEAIALAEEALRVDAGHRPGRRSFGIALHPGRGRICRLVARTARRNSRGRRWLTPRSARNACTRRGSSASWVHSPHSTSRASSLPASTMSTRWPSPTSSDCARSRPTLTWSWGRCTPARGDGSRRARRCSPPPSCIARWRWTSGTPGRRPCWRGWRDRTWDSSPRWWARRALARSGS